MSALLLTIIHRWVIKITSVVTVCLLIFEYFSFQSSWPKTDHGNYFRFFLWDTEHCGKQDFWSRLSPSKISLIFISSSLYDLRKTQLKLLWLEKCGLKKEKKIMVLMEMKFANSNHCDTIMTKLLTTELYREIKLFGIYRFILI